MGKTLLALDVSKRCTGWAFGEVCPGGLPAVHGTVQFGDESSSDPRVWKKAFFWLYEQINILHPDVVAIEASIRSPSMGGHSNPDTFILLNGLQAVMRMLVEMKLPVSAPTVNVQKARAFFIGHGNLRSDQAKREVQQRCVALQWIAPLDVQPDVCDAMCAWAFQASLMDAALAKSLKVTRRREPAKAEA